MTDTSTRALTADGFEAALIGFGTQFNTDLAVYDYEKCVDILVERDSMDRDEAMEFMEFNVTGAWMGPHTPVFLRHTTLEDYLGGQGTES